MIKKTITLLTLFIPSSFSFSILSANTSNNVDKNTKNIANNLRKQLKQEIIENSEKISTGEYWQYDGQDFENAEKLNQYLVKIHKIEKVITTSNVGKIVKDYEFNLLDDKKIYSANIKDYQMVYEDLYGKAVLNKNEALRSFNSEIQIKQRYSYHFTTDNWYDSPEEAKEKTITAGVKNSWYIYLNKKYYNVINDKDALLSKLIPGYFVHKSKFTKTNNNKEEDVFGTYDHLKKVIRQRYESTWINEDLWDYVDFTAEYKVNIKPKDSIILKINNQILPEYVLNGGSNKEINVNQILSDNTWSFEDQFYGWGKCVKKTIYRQRFKDNQNKDIIITLIPQGGSFCYQANALPSASLDAIDVSTVRYDLYKTKQAKTEKDKSKLLTSIEIPKRVENKNDLPTQERKKLYRNWFNNYFFNNEFINSASSKNIYGVEKDYLYTVNSNLIPSNHNSFMSFKESSNYFKAFIKPKLMKNENGKYIFNGCEFTEEQINQYLYLKDYSFYEKMYNYHNSDNLTSIDGSLLSSSRWEAETKMKYYDKKILNKRFFIYHLQTLKPELSAGTHAEAVELFSKTLKLKTKYVHRNEIKNWKGKKAFFDSIITDGRYAVYRIAKKNGQKANQTPSYFYYKSYDDAIKSIRKSEQHKISTANKYLKFYLYKDKQNNSHLFTYKNDIEIDAIIDKIITLT